MRKRVYYILDNAITPFLKSYGFKKNKYVYTSERNNLYWLIDIQFSLYNDKSQFEFTSNIGIYIPGVIASYMLNKIKEPRKNISSTDCCINTRIGALTEKGTDKWWTLSDRDNVEITDILIADDFKDMLIKYGIPFLENFDSINHVAEFLAKTGGNNIFYMPRNEAIRYAYAAIIYYVLGNTKKQKNLINKAADLSLKSPIEDHIKALKDLYG